MSEIDLVDEFYKADREIQMDVAVAVAETIAASDFLDCAEEAGRDVAYTDIFVSHAEDIERMPDDWLHIEDIRVQAEDNTVLRIYRLLAEGNIEEAAREMRREYSFLRPFEAEKSLAVCHAADRPYHRKRDADGNFINHPTTGEPVWETA